MKLCKRYPDKFRDIKERDSEIELSHIQWKK
jgi:hypothetical protein